MQKSFPELSKLLDRSSLRTAVLPDSRILVGVSGGADSIALLMALCSFQKSYPLKIHAVHVNHNTRSENSKEADFVRNLCCDLGVRLSVRVLDESVKPGGVSPEEFWRKRRYEAFRETFMSVEADFLALGHNLDDLAESFLFHLVRGTGLSGLSFDFCKPVDGLSIIRPLWKTPRNLIETALAGINQDFISDPSNADIRFSRNRIRHEVIPVLKTINPQVNEAILRASEAIGYRLTDFSPAGEQLILGELRGLESVQIRNRIYGFITSQSNQPPAYRQIMQAVSMVEKNKTGTVALGYGRTLVITQQMLWVAAGDQPSDMELAMEHALRFGGFLMKLDVPVELEPGEHILSGINGRSILLIVHKTISLRNRAPGDKIGGRSLKKALIQYQLPWYLRNFTILVEHHGEVLDLVGSFPLIAPNVFWKRGKEPFVTWKALDNGIASHG